MKQLVVMLLLTILLTTVGCTQDNEFHIEYQEFSEEQQEMLKLTGNSAFKYEIQNIPNDRAYEMKLMYEVYENGQKIDETQLYGILSDEPGAGRVDYPLAINIHEGQIRCLGGEGWSTVSIHEIDEDISTLSWQGFANKETIKFGEDIYLFHGLTAENGIWLSDLGRLSEEDKGKYIKENQLNLFIKLVFEECVD